MVLSGSSGNIEISQSLVFCRTTRDFAFATQLGWVRGGTSQAKNRNATTTMISPRARPNRNPSVRSSAPTRLSRTISENRTVMIDTIRSVPRNVPPMTTAAAMMSLLKKDFAHEAANHGQQRRHQHDADQDDVEERHDEPSILPSLLCRPVESGAMTASN